MRVRKATVILSAEVSEVHIVDVIEHEGQFWLVPEWLENPIQRLRRPMRIVSLSRLPHQRMRNADPEFVVNDAIPKSVFDGQIPPGQAETYLVVELPDICIPIVRRDRH
jgi:hypothetical protein